MHANCIHVNFQKHRKYKRQITRDVIFYLLAGNSALTHIQLKVPLDLSIGVADVINHTTFGNDRSREYKVTEGRILSCSIDMACRLWHDCATCNEACSDCNSALEMSL